MAEDLPAYLMDPLDLSIYGQVIQGGAGGAFVSWHVYTDQVQVLWKELRVHKPRVSIRCARGICPLF